MTREWYLSQISSYAQDYAAVAGLLVLCILLILCIGYLLKEGQEATAESKRLEWLHSAYRPLTPEQQTQAEADMRAWECAQFERMRKNHDRS